MNQGAGSGQVVGGFEARGRHFAIAAASFNGLVVERLVAGALECFGSHGLGPEAVTVAWAPGSFELPLLARRLAATGRYDGVACLGAVIRGETAHFDFVAAEAARGIQQVALETDVPVGFGVLTTDTLEQALDRAGGKHGNRGWDAATTLMRMASVLDQLPQKD
ncbi:6,7-dimethyl-8-ribityllumazine synthase [soil metagenome]